MRPKRRHVLLAYLALLGLSHQVERVRPPPAPSAWVPPAGSAAEPVVVLSARGLEAHGPGLAAAGVRPRTEPPAGEGWFLFAEDTDAPAAVRRAATPGARGLILLDPVGPDAATGLGSATLNRTLAHLWRGAVWAVQEAVPHFGALRDWPVAAAEAGRWLAAETDGLDAALDAVACPTLLLRTPRAPLLLEDAAGEVHRRLPHSHLTRLEAGQPPHPAARAFLADALAGRAVDRAGATVERRAASEKPFSGRTPPTGRTLALVVLLLVLCMQTSEDLTCIGAGLVASTGFLPVGWAIFGCGLGLVLGDSGLYLIGRWVGRPLLRVRPFRLLVSERALDRAAAQFHRKGFWIVFTSRFMPGARVPMYVVAGLLHMPFLRFVAYLTLAAAIWTPVLVGLCAHFGEPILAFIEANREHALAWTVAIFLLLWWIVHAGLPLFTWRGRRLWVGAWRRRLHWEFWPRWAFYPPVALYLMWLMIRHRSLTLPTAVNPGMPAGGGLVEESKSAILTGLGSNGEWVARWRLLPIGLPLEEKLQACAAFGYPCVLKPDVGCRGSGVAVVDDAAQARRYLEACPLDVILQAFVPGVEYGIFYTRRPGEPRGRIISITEKVQTTVVADGVSTVERLILSDPRGCAMAGFFLDKFAERLEEIPPAGTPFKLTRLGTHARGALFLDAADLLTPELEARIDEISRAYAGFYFGRYDIRGPSAEAFRAGGPFQVVELNGLTSESTHIYDPKTPLLTAYRTLFRQWRLAFEIGALNRDAGHAPLTLRELRALLRQHANAVAFESPV